MHGRLDAKPPERDHADLKLSGREDSNLRPFGPEPNALPGCATPRRREAFVCQERQWMSTWVWSFFRVVEFATDSGQDCPGFPSALVALGSSPR